MPGAWLALTTAVAGASRSTVGLPAPGAGAMSCGWNIFTRPWLLPQSSADVMIAACRDASSSSQPIIRSACFVVCSASATPTMTVSLLDSARRGATLTVRRVSIDERRSIVIVRAKDEHALLACAELRNGGSRQPFVEYSAGSPDNPECGCPPIQPALLDAGVYSQSEIDV